MKYSTHVAATVAVLAMAVAAVTGCARHEPAPNVPYTLLNGSRHQLADLRGQVVLVNFWATSCAPCVKEMPQLAATHQRFKTRGLETLAVAMRYDPPVYVAQFAQSRQLPFGVVLDIDGAIARDFGDVQVTPTTVVIDREGRMVKRYVGEPDFNELNALIDRLLAPA